MKIHRKRFSGKVEGFFSGLGVKRNASSTSKVPLEKSKRRFGGGGSINPVTVSNELHFKQSSEPNGDTFQDAIGGTLLVARALGVFPVLGLWGPPAGVRFRARGALSAVSAVATIPVLWIYVTAMVFAIKAVTKTNAHSTGGIVNKLAGAIFYANALVSVLILRHVARGWPELALRWRAEELRAALRPGPPLRLKLSLIAAVVLGLAFIEHTLSVLNKTSDCQNAIRSGNSTFLGCMSEYCMKSHGFVFSLVNYNVALGVLVILASEVATFTWNFQDLFLIQISVGLVTRFKHVNSIVQRMDVETTRPTQWRFARELFCGSLELGRFVGNLLGPLILLSFTNNLFFICLQMFNGIGPGDQGALHDAYFFGSFGFMVGRVTCVALAAASLPIETKRVLPALRCCPANIYCPEVHRLSQQLVNDEVTFSGMGFFTVNRNFMLGVAGAIATYEVVLLQFMD